MAPLFRPEKNIIFLLDKRYNFGYKRRNWHCRCLQGTKLNTSIKILSITKGG